MNLFLFERGQISSENSPFLGLYGSPVIPRKGEFIRFKGRTYEVVRVLHEVPAAGAHMPQQSAEVTVQME
jgi:hypothetical protein